VKPPLVVYTVIPDRHSASHYYRLRVPLETASDLGLPVRAIIDHNDLTVSPGDRIKAFCESDLILLYQPIGDQPVQNVRGVQSFIASKRDGAWKWPPTFVVESDDNLFNVSPLNQAFRSLGVRDMEGNTIPLKHHVGVVQQGERKVLWRDVPRDGEPEDPALAQIPMVDLLKNRQTLATYRKLMEMADAVTCSTQGVVDAISKELTPRRTRVFPNLVRMDHYEQVDLREDPFTIKILWQGGIAHYEDWYPLREALGNITRKYPEVHWIIWGAQFPWVKELIPAHRYTFKSWCPYQEYKLRLSMIGHDISLAPLSSNVFNDCRSAIKFYEASALKKPAATLAQNTAAYKAEIKDGETGLLFNDPEEFETQLSLLIENEKERRVLAANAKDWISENRDAMKRVPEMVAYWEDLREQRKREQPHVSDEQWETIQKEAEAEEAAAAPA
jgi:glycosyltransferase involved in cell wall biosynthesis